MRDEHGRFVPGAAANPGGRSSEQAARITALQNAVTDADITAIMRKAVAQARRGNIRAMEFLCDRLFGKALQAQEQLGEVLIRIIYGDKGSNPDTAQVTQPASSGQIESGEAQDHLPGP